MNFISDLNFGHIITLGLAVVGSIGGYFTLRAATTVLQGRSDVMDKRVDAYGTALVDLRTHVAESCVKRDDLKRVEDRLTVKLDQVESGIRNALMELARVGRPSTRWGSSE